MLELFRLQRSSLVYVALGLAAIIGWSSFACSTWSARHLSRRVSTLTAERDQVVAERNEARAKHEQLQQAAGELHQVEAKLNVGNAELARTVRAWAAAEQKLVSLNRRLEGTSASQTGSIRKTAPAKGLTR